jgi:hypothetical protein
MFPELIRALPVAVVICVVPGYFWSRLLCAPEDHASRLAYSVALSITLVPAVALAQIRLTGSGLTFAVAVVSPLAVFAAGLAAYRLLGSRKEDAGPLLEKPATPAIPELALISAAFVVVLANLAGAIPDWLAWPATALLVLSAGTTYLLNGPRPEDPSFPASGGTGLSDIAHRVLLAVILALVLVRGYLGPVTEDWPFLRADDQYLHTIMTRLMISEGSTESFMLYPPGIHLLMAEVSHLSGLDPLEIFAVLIPALLVPPALALYALARHLWGREYGLVAALFYGLLAGGPYWYLEHGRYPNIIAAQFLMVLVIATLFRLYRTPSWRSGTLLALLGSSVVLYHQVGSFYTALLLGLVGALFLPHILLRERHRGLALVSSFSVLGVLSVLYAWTTYDLPRLAGALLGGSEAGRGGDAVEMVMGTKSPESLGAIIEMTSQPLLWLGLLGVMFLAFGGERQPGSTGTLVRVLLISWTAMMLVGSLTSMSGFPDRFQRDLGVPLALLAALAFVTVLRSVSARRGAATLIVASLATLAAATVVDLRAMTSLVKAGEPSAQQTLAPQVATAGEWLAEHNTGGNIVVSPYVHYLPSRGMLALGGYTGIQSYDVPRIENARDLPPMGPGPLWDALWLLENPTGEHTRRLTEQYDVRYVVLSKLYPSSSWPAFEAHPDLYQPVFENELVIIFEPRR